MATTTIQPLPYPGPGDSPDVPRDLKALAEAVEDRTVMRFASAAARDAAIPSGRRVPGMHAYIESENGVYVWDGGEWRAVWRDTGWLPITPRVNVVSQGAEARRIGDVVYIRGTLVNGASSPEAPWATGVHSLGTLPPEVGGSWTSGTSARTITGNTPAGIPGALQAWIADRTITIYQGTATASSVALSGLSGLAP